MDTDRKIIFSLAIPAVLQTVVRSLFVIIDAFWVGKLGSKELAAITVATFLVWGIIALGEIIAVGTNTLVAQRIGARDNEMAKHISSLNLVNTFFHSIIIALIIIPVLPLLYWFMNLAPEEISLANNYLITLLIGLPCITLLSTSSAIFRSYGDTKTPFYMFVLAVVLNIFLAPLFIFGLNGYLQFGLTGAAFSTLISFLMAFVISYYLLRKRGMVDGIYFKKINVDNIKARSLIKTFGDDNKRKTFNDFSNWKILKETIKIGIPVAINGVAFSLIYVFVARFVADYGTVGFAALGIGHRSESLAFQIGVGFSFATTVLVGQNIGAGDTKKAERLAWKIFGYSCIIMFIYASILFSFSKEFAKFFIDDSEVIRAASVYNKLAASVMIFSAAELIFGGAFSGAGNTTPTAVIGLPLNILRIPLAAIFSAKYGLYGIWLAICITVVFKGILIMIWFKMGKWKKKKIAFSSDNVVVEKADVWREM